MSLCACFGAYNYKRDIKVKFYNKTFEQKGAIMWELKNISYSQTMQMHGLVEKDVKVLTA